MTAPRIDPDVAYTQMARHMRECKNGCGDFGAPSEQDLCPIGRALLKAWGEAECYSAQEAGRELDVLVAERVMGWEYRQSSPDPKRWFCREYGNDAGWWKVPATKLFTNGWQCATCSPPPNYSTEIAAAWTVVEHLSFPADRCYFDIAIDPDGLWTAEFGAGFTSPRVKTAPHAICLGALRAVGAALQKNGDET